MEPRSGETGGTAMPGPAGDAARAGHDVLLAMAGRLPDRLLWRLRDWLAAGAEVALRTAVPRALLRYRVGITEGERALLRAAVSAWGGSARLVDAVPHVDAAPEPSSVFVGHGPAGRAPGWDAADQVLRALVPGVAGVEEVRRAWRSGRAARRSVPVPPDRVVLVDAGRELPWLTGAVQRALRAHGELDPRVEVIGPGSPITGYHDGARAASELLWRAASPSSVRLGDRETRGTAPFPDSRRGPSAGELVRDG